MNGRKTTIALYALALLARLAYAEENAEALQVPNGGFETAGAPGAFARNWRAEIGGNASATVTTDDRVARTGTHSIRISNRSPQKAFVYAAVASDPVAANPNTTYEMHFWAKGAAAHGCYAGIGFDKGGDHRLYLPAGDFDWREFVCLFTTPNECDGVTLRFSSDDVTASLWIDDVSLRRARLQLANIAERRYQKDFHGVYPRSEGHVARRLMVCDISNASSEMLLALAALQGIINRRNPELYLLNPTNPPHQDEVWLEYMKQKGYTGANTRTLTPKDAVALYRDRIGGAIVIDPALPGSVNAACMLSGILNAVPAPLELARELSLPVVMDLRGKWTRNVDAYRFVYDNYWDRMNHHILAWSHPTASSSCSRDYMVEFKVFTFWVSGYADNEPGADPAAEEAFVNELLANTPANIPVMGWPSCGDTKGMTEYSGVRWLSEYGKFVPGTEFCSNLSVHTAIHPSRSALARTAPLRQADVPLEPDKAYISVNVLDSGDALWYWQCHQRKIWADPERGACPVGWCMNIGLGETLPLVLQWYQENATANDEFFAGVSGLGYMNTQVYASRFRIEDRERIWRDYVGLTDRYCRKLGVRGIELYNGSWGEPTPPTPETFRRFTHGVKHLDYILADLGRHENVKPDRASYLSDDTAVFHTLTRFQVWSSSAEVNRNDKSNANQWLLDEITSHAPSQRPGFMSAMAISWYYYPSWLKDLRDKLPKDFVAVAPSDLARLLRKSQSR